MTHEKDSVRHKTHDGVDKMIDKAEDFREYTAEEINHIKEQAMSVKENVDGYIKKNPEKFPFAEEMKKEETMREENQKNLIRKQKGSNRKNIIIIIIIM